MSYRENYKLIDWNAREIALPQRDRSAKARSALPGPMIISDAMPETEHPCDGRFYTSKSKFRRTTRAHGCVEVGNDRQRFKVPAKKKADVRSIDRSLDRALSRT